MPKSGGAGRGGGQKGGRGGTSSGTSSRPASAASKRQDSERGRGSARGHARPAGSQQPQQHRSRQATSSASASTGHRPSAAGQGHHSNTSNTHGHHSTNDTGKSATSGATRKGSTSSTSTAASNPLGATGGSEKTSTGSRQQHRASRKPHENSQSSSTAKAPASSSRTSSAGCQKQHQSTGKTHDQHLTHDQSKSSGAASKEAGGVRPRSAGPKAVDRCESAKPATKNQKSSRASAPGCDKPQPDKQRGKKGWHSEDLTSAQQSQTMTHFSSGASDRSFNDHYGASFEPDSLHLQQASRPASTRTRTSGKSTINKSKLEQTAREIKDHLMIVGVSHPDRDLRSFFDAEVKLLQEEKNEAANSVNQLRTAILKTLNSSFPWNWSYLNSGSHYDGVKVTRPDEVDCMFFPVDVNQWLEVDYDGAPSEFCYIKLRKPGAGKEDEEKYTRLADLCELHEDDLYLSSTKYRDKIFEVFEVEIKKHRLARIDPDAKAGCPSFMVQLRVRPRGRGVPTIDLDLLPSLKLEGWPKVSKACLRGLRKDDKDAIKAAGFHVIPKQCKEAAYRKTKHLLWRLSYSAAEKHLTLHADGKLANPDGSPTCRKLVMRVLKRLLEIFKEVNNSFVRKEPNETLIRLQQATAVAREWLQLGHEFEVSKFSSFQIRTLMWNEYFKKTSPGAWANENRRGRLQDALVHMKDMLAGDLHVEHFFVPDLDIMKDVPRQEREFLYILFSIAKDLF